MTNFVLNAVELVAFERDKEHPPKILVPEETLESSSVEDALEEVFRRWNHAIPGQTGDLAEKYSTRSLSVGDFVVINGRRFQCDNVGWKEIVGISVELNKEQ